MSGEKKRVFDYKTLIMGIAIALITTLIVMILEALVMSVTDMPDTLAAPLSSIALSIGVFLGGFFVSQKTKEKGMLQGGALGIASFLIITLISLIVDSSGVSLITLIHAAVTLLSGCIGGILGVNTGNKRKF